MLLLLLLFALRFSASILHTLPGVDIIRCILAYIFYMLHDEGERLKNELCTLSADMQKQQHCFNYAITSTTVRYATYLTPYAYALK